MGTFTTKDDAKLFYRLQGKQKGNRPTLLFIHGWCSNLAHWEPQVRYFSSRYRVLRIDRRGMGRSTSTGADCSAKDHAADIAAVIKSVGIKRVIAIGHAGGGPSTLELTRSCPRLVKAAVMVDAGLYPEPSLDPPAGFGERLAPMIAALDSPKGKTALKQMYQGFFSPKCEKSIARKAVSDAIKTPLDVAMSELKGMVANTEAIAGDIKQPVLWLTATDANQQHISSHLDNVQFAQVVGSGHFPQLEVPAQTNAMIDTFLSQL